MRAEEYIQTAIMLGAKRVNIGTADMFGRELMHIKIEHQRI